MNLPPRQQQILELVRERGYVSIEEMAQLFVVTPQTIRRDINQLAEANLLRRYHGGAAYDSSIENTAYAMRADQMRDEKQRIAEAVARQIPDHASLFINIGTTTESIARALLNHNHLKIITNNLHVAAILAAKDDFEVLVAGAPCAGTVAWLARPASTSSTSSRSISRWWASAASMKMAACWTSTIRKCGYPRRSSPMPGRCSSPQTPASSAVMPWCDWGRSA